MGSKAILLLGLFLAFTLLVASEVAVNEKSDSILSTEGANGLDDAKYGGGGYGPGSGRYCRYGCCRRMFYGRRCRVCCRYAGEKAVTAQPEDKPNN